MIDSRARSCASTVQAIRASLLARAASQNVWMQALRGANKPGPEAVLRPIRWPQQNDPGCLFCPHTQRHAPAASAWSAYHSLAAWFETREYCILENRFGGWEPGVLAWAFNLQ